VLVVPEIKFCGLTRADDAAAAASFGAHYVGVIFAGGPRDRSIDAARHTLAKVPRSVKRVGVVADQSIEEITALVRALSLDVVQLHADPSPDRIRDVRAAAGVDTWAVMRIAGSKLPPSFEAVAREANAVVLDARTPSGLGGTGVALPWADLATEVRRWRDRVQVVLAGGLRPENVAEAIAAMEPDIVDVSSGVESAPGIKDHERMRAFRDAVQRTGVTGR
jgi:phosphoribosylanthranilate isomerase